MKLFNSEIIDLVNQYFSNNEEYVESILVASYGFNIQFLSFTIYCSERVFASIGGKTYEWEDAPTSAPWGLLGRQLAVKASLKGPSIFSITFTSGDSIDIETCENQYESVIFEFPPEDGALIMEIF
ncbi:hypothetical protein [Thalassolituus sp. C2-1]|uniref:hypothetical protein n=1 Tax=Venatorbacter sp. C2-1 TaxID=2597518 RepID=UPI0011912F74|nr:hypothetical protein [Thalassolituus sp. C2-1]TVV41991.1 hypothetical protein FOT50_18560 [Thalassolituus sp. C2-1]